jgi:hypothetical protein
VTIGIPIFGAIAATQADVLDGIHLAMQVQIVCIVLAVALIWFGLRRRPETPSAGPGEDAVPAQMKSDLAKNPA